MPAFVFPGQGAQRPGMGIPWLEHPSWEVVEEASVAADRDIGRLLTDADDQELMETRNAQVATFTFSLLVLDAVERLGIVPTRLAGHSVGEYTALAASGALGFEESIRLVAERGEAMQAAADGTTGAMTVISGCDADTVDIACRLADGEVWVANFNSAEETVIAGHPESLERAASLALDMGARRSVPVKVGGAFHTPFMAPARDRLRKMLATITLHDPDTPIVANVDGRFHTRGEDWRLLLSAQLCSPIRWYQSIMRLAGLDDPELDIERCFVELGPGDSLSSMIRQTLPAATTVTVRAPADLDHLVEAVSGDSALHAYALDHQGEQLYVSERVVISPIAGVFEPVPDGPVAGDRIEVGTLLGTVSGQEVLAPFAGRLEGGLAQPGERVQAGQPIVWLHTA
ncbi:MAG TPA: acyltransferase domain-containing protein [Acidimicrobiales bacterium]|nr:acyltransferase domain-containing protein [Acidimicrobiales bacterium]